MSKKQLSMNQILRQKALERRLVESQRERHKMASAYHSQKFVESLIHHTKLTICDELDISPSSAEKMLYQAVVKLYKDSM